jgi:hypothetical protein
MINDLPRPETSPRGPEARPRTANQRSAYVSFIDDLVRLRELVVDRLASIETLAGQRQASEARARELAALEEALKIRSDELEKTRRGLKEQADRAQRDWNASLSQLEHDRRSLAEAWERLEQARIDTSKPPRENPSRQSRGQSPQTAVSTGRSRTGPTIPIRSADADSDADNPVDRAILQQYQSLYHDVRQSARGRWPAR